MGDTIRIFTGRLVLSVSDDFHEVELFRNDKKLKKGFGYIKGDYVYVYRGKKDKFKKSDLVPGIYINKLGEYEFIEPETKQDKEDYNAENVVELDTHNIIEKIAEDSDNFIDPEDIEIINNNSEIYTPTMKEGDDFLKFGVKKAITDKEINLKNYRNKFTNQYALNNMKSGLNKDTKMTVTNFDIWSEILGLKWKMIIEDNGTDKMNPLPEPIVITSDDF